MPGHKGWVHLCTMFQSIMAITLIRNPETVSER